MYVYCPKSVSVTLLLFTSKKPGVIYNIFTGMMMIIIILLDYMFGINLLLYSRFSVSSLVVRLKIIFKDT